ncbi:MAG: type IV secretion system DNA-binding domain-containing protein [Gordonia sp. (in: high G+C Gram-positive bacteria)]|uniref:type IV secretory system conjugative DNA transfer family protein n=1 Tax=Gordonia sp. (in: high G+C Gram-positive bacteria) TaxID=84139 RepID=UPI0039E58F5C
MTVDAMESEREAAQATVPAPLTITGLRPRSADAGTESVHDAIVSMLRLLPGAEIAIESGAKVVVRPDALPSLVVRIDSPAGEICDELETVLDAEVSTARLAVTGAAPRHVWRGRPEGAALGFRTGAQRGGTWTVHSEVGVRDRARLWQALNLWGEGHVEVRIVAVDDQWFAVSVAVAGATPPPLGVRAALRDNFPGLVFAPARFAPARFAPARFEPACFEPAGTETERFRCDESAVRLSLLLPVGPDRPGGFLLADPAGLPMRMTTTLRDTRPGVGGVRVGAAQTDAAEPVDVVLGDGELLRHLHVVGATGTGKSTLLAGMVHELAHSGNGALVLDPHGTLVDRIVAEWPAVAAERLVVVRADDLEHPVPLNPLASEDPVEVATAIADIGDMFQEMFDPRGEGIVGPRFIDRVSHALRGLVRLRGTRASLLDVPLMLGHRGMRVALAEIQNDPREALWWRTELAAGRSSEHGELEAWTNSKFERFSAAPALTAILGSGEDAYDPVGAMDTGQVILVDLAKGRIGRSAARLLGYLLLNRFWTAAMNRNTDRRFHVIVDEAHAVMAGSLVNMLSEGRKFGISVTAAHQYLGQLPKDVSEALAGNVGTSIAFRLNGPHVAEHVAASGGLVSASTLANLPMFHSIVTRNAAAGVTARPFTMTVDPATPDCEPVHVDAVTGAMRRRLEGLDGTRLDPDLEYGDGRTTTKRTPVREPGRPSPSAPEPPGASFLDEWLARRQAQQRATPTPPDPDLAESHPAEPHPAEPRPAEADRGDPEL